MEHKDTNKRDMTEKTHGIVLRRVRYNDTGLIVDIFTASRGTVTFLVKIGKGGRRKLQALAPLTLAEVSFRWRTQHTLQHLDEVQVARPYSTLSADPMKASVALFLQEFLYHTLKHEVANKPLYDYLEQSMEWLDSHGEGLANFHLTFMLRLTRHLGLWPRTYGWREGCVFDLKEGVMTEMLPAHRFYTGITETSYIPHITRMTFRSMRLFKMNRTQRNVILDVLLAYYRLHVPEFPELKSVEMLREVFA